MIAKTVAGTNRDATTPAPRASDAHLIVRAKLMPPRRRSHLVPRPEVALKLARVVEYPLTIVRADAGYGKSTALAALAESFAGRSFWYGLADPDGDPHVFLVHLVGAFQLVHPAIGTRALASLQQEGGTVKHGTRAVDALANDLFDVLTRDAVLVLDDYHVAEGTAVNAIVDRLIEHMPPTLHVVIGTRRAPRLGRLARGRAAGDVLDVTRSDLAFTPADVAALFRRARRSLAADQAFDLAEAMEGWPIALQLLAQRHRSEARTDQLHRLVEHLPERLDGLFAYLADEVLDAEPPRIQEFLLRSSVLRRIDPVTCDRVLGRGDSADLLREIEERSLFVSGGDRGDYRYHPLFHEFLVSKARGSRPAAWRRLHRRAATIYRLQGEHEEAIHHALEAHAHRTASLLLEEVAGAMIQTGRYATLAAWLEALPASILGARPELLRAQADIARLTSRFGDASAAYRRAREQFAAMADRAGESRAIEGEALVYLDTVQPARAAPLIRVALARTERGDRDRRGHLLLLATENLANRGDLRRAERLQRAIHRARGAPEIEIDPRIYVRQGRFTEARRLLERDLRREEAAAGPAVPRSHRESTAVLAWIAAFTGHGDAARNFAEQALRRGRELQAPIVEVVALSRLGHGWLTGTGADADKALGFYAESLALADQLGVARFRVESLIGQIVAFGYDGRFEVAHEAAREALTILDDAGDRYLTGVVWIALGAAGVVVEHPEASVWLATGAEIARRCGDRYGPALAAVWQAHHAVRTGEWEALDRTLTLALRAAEAHDLGCLFTAHPFLGLKRPADLETLLRAGLKRGIEVRLARYFLGRLLPSASGRSGPAVPPPLRVQALGEFRVWTGEREIVRGAWSRGKALELFQFLLGHAGRAVHREEIQEALWPEAAPASSALGLRVALNALQHALEPDRVRGAEPRFVRREGTGLVLDDGPIWLDTHEFAAAIRQARKEDAAGRPTAALAAFRKALALYRGDYLEDAAYAEWAVEPRRELAALYLRAAERTAEILMAQGYHDEAQDVCEAVLRRDRTAEDAYALLMRAQHALGQRAAALRTFERCRQAVREDLGVEPSPGLVQLRASLARTSVPAASDAEQSESSLHSV